MYTVRRPLTIAYPAWMSAESSTVPTSRTNTVRVPLARIATSPNRLTSLIVELTGTIGIVSPKRTFPDGLIALPFAIAATISSGDMLYARNRSGSAARRSRAGSAERRRRRHAWQASRTAAARETAPQSCKSLRLSFGSSLENTSVPTGTLPASKRMTNGGTVPGGMNARARFTYDTVSAIARDMSGPGWNCSLISAAPWMDLDSTCSMPLT
jgi:hypothetical protein